MIEKEKENRPGRLGLQREGREGMDMAEREWIWQSLPPPPPQLIRS